MPAHQRTRERHTGRGGGSGFRESELWASASLNLQMIPRVLPRALQRGHASVNLPAEHLIFPAAAAAAAADGFALARSHARVRVRAHSALSLDPHKLVPPSRVRALGPPPPPPTPACSLQIYGRARWPDNSQQVAGKRSRQYSACDVDAALRQNACPESRARERESQ